MLLCHPLRIHQGEFWRSVKNFQHKGKEKRSGTSAKDSHTSQSIESTTCIDSEQWIPSKLHRGSSKFDNKQAQVNQCISLRVWIHGFNIPQGQEEEPSESLQRRKGLMRKCLGWDTEGPSGQVMLKLHFVTDRWPDRVRKSQKIESRSGGERNYFSGQF